jgi:hypothetical protein
MGTTALAVFFGFGKPLWRLWRDSFQGKTWRDGWRDMSRGIKAALKDGAIITFLFWLGLLLLHVFYTVPRKIRQDANIYRPVHVLSQQLTPKWKEQYDVRQQHMSKERAAAKGWITKDREEHIQGILAASPNKCQVTLAPLDAIDPRQIDPLRAALKQARWPSPNNLAQIDPTNHGDVLAVSYLETGKKCARVGL